MGILKVFDIWKERFIEKVKNKKEVLKRSIHLLSKQKFKLIAVLIIIIASIGLKLTTPLALGKIFDVIFEGVIQPLYYHTGDFYIDFYKLRDIILLLLVKCIASVILIDIQKYVMNIVANDFVQSLREEVSRKLSRIPLRFYNARKRKETLNYVSRDLECISQALQNNFMDLITSTIKIVGTVFLMLKINWILASVSLVSIFLVIIVTAIISMKSYQRFRNKQQSIEVYDGSTVMKFFQYIIIAGLGFVFMIQGRLSFGQIQAFFQYMNKASNPFTGTTATLGPLQSALASAERIFDTLDEVERQERCQKISRMAPSKRNIILKV